MVESANSHNLILIKSLYLWRWSPFQSHIQATYQWVTQHYQKPISRHFMKIHSNLGKPVLGAFT